MRAAAGGDDNGGAGAGPGWPRRAFRGRVPIAAVVAVLIVALAMAGLAGAQAAGRSASPSTAAAHLAARPARGRPGRFRSRPGTTPAVFAGAVADVPPAPPGWTITAGHLQSGGRTRAYLVARPSAPGRPANIPVVVVLHGRMLTPADIERLSGFLGLVGRAVVVYPAGYDQSWDAGYCCGGAHRARVNDVAFLEALIRKVTAAQPGTSIHDVYLVGYSNGGRMAYRMACADPVAFAGIATVEAVAVSSCSRAAAVPLIAVASTRDPLLSIGPSDRPRHISGHTEVTVDALLAHWRQLEGCPTRDVTTVVGHVATTEWTGCRHGSRVELAIYTGGSHHWPEGGARTPSAQRLIWAFFRTGPGPV